MIKITNIQATRAIGAVLILLSGNAFAVHKPKTPPPPPAPQYATQTALNTEITTRANADTAEVAGRNAAIGVEAGNRIGADSVEVTSRNAAIAVEATAREAAIAVETARAMAAEAEAAGAGTTIADGTQKGDTLKWDGSAWTPVAAEPVYILGDIRPNGGVVYYVDGSGHHGLAAQPNDEASAMNWSDAMAAAQAHNNPSCPTDILKTPTCWHLPTKTEIESLWENRFVGVFANYGYWSSTEYDASYAWGQGFGSAYGSTDDHKIYNLNVRAVQAF